MKHHKCRNIKIIPLVNEVYLSIFVCSSVPMSISLLNITYLSITFCISLYIRMFITILASIDLSPIIFKLRDNYFRKINNIWKMKYLNWRDWAFYQNTDVPEASFVPFQFLLLSWEMYFRHFSFFFLRIFFSLNKYGRISISWKKEEKKMQK